MAVASSTWAPTGSRRGISRGLLVMQTYVQADGAYQLHFSPDEGRDAARLIVRTTDIALYEYALALEGSPTRVTVEWHTEPGLRGRHVHVLDRAWRTP